MLEVTGVRAGYMGPIERLVISKSDDKLVKDLNWGGSVCSI